MFRNTFSELLAAFGQRKMAGIIVIIWTELSIEYLLDVT